MPDFLDNRPPQLIEWLDRGKRSLAVHGYPKWYVDDICDVVFFNWSEGRAEGEAKYLEVLFSIHGYGAKTESMFWALAQTICTQENKIYASEVFEILSNAEDAELDEWGVPVDG